MLEIDVFLVNIWYKKNYDNMVFSMSHAAWLTYSTNYSKGTCLNGFNMIELGII